MIVTCPSCRTRYDIDPEVLGERGRTVRCARCGHGWQEHPLGDMPEEVDEASSPEQLQSLLEATRAPARAKRRRLARSLAWAGLVVLVALAVGAAIVERDRVAALWPPAAELYEMAGLKVVPCSEGLRLRPFTAAREQSDDEVVIVVKGEVFNDSSGACLVPHLRAELRNADRQVLRSWKIAPAKQRLRRGESTPATDRFTDPPSGAVDLWLTFDVQG